MLIIPINRPVSLRKLAEIVEKSPANEVLLVPSGHISKRQLKDVLHRFLLDNLREDDEVVLTQTFQNGSLYLGNVCRTFHENYIPIWYYRWPRS